ncbi:MAG: hypothetical protein EZS28_053593 [Streblomastix strix]|uniref:Uncharacterized protein n=1 Tax=Streblomastix strix TaxID=222440 RepID=A0A5J4RA36_9EUKA|nr:MAG: hypothetical protein EZS28_053593 [Streblomastix strix]
MAVSSPPPIEYVFGEGIAPVGLVNCISAGLAHSPLEYVLSFLNRLVREVLSHFHDNPCHLLLQLHKLYYNPDLVSQIKYQIDPPHPLK